MNKTKRFAVICAMASVLLLLTLPAMAAGTIVSIDDASAVKGDTTTTPINITGLAEQLGSVTVVLDYNANVEVVGVTPGTMGAVTPGINNTAHRTTLVWYDGVGMTGDQTFVVVELRAVGDPGTISPLDITVTEFVATNLSEIPVTDDDGEFTIRGDATTLTATRDISNQTVEAGSMFEVTLTLTANDNVMAPALDEDLPTGWIVEERDSAGAIYDPPTTVWVWAAAMSGGETKTVVYNVTVPADATPQDYDITGYASANKVDPIEIGGESRVTVETPPGCARCLGDCYDAAGALVASDVPCYECIGTIGVLWENYPCPVSACGCTCPSMPHEICPECCDGIDNDGMNGTDWPADPQCGCCIDGNETDGTDPCPPPCVPELPTLALAGIGILGIALLARKRD